MLNGQTERNREETHRGKLVGANFLSDRREAGHCAAGNEGKNSNYSGTHLGCFFFCCGENDSARRLNLHRQLIQRREIWKSRATAAAAACRLSARELALYESHRIRVLNALHPLSLVFFSRSHTRTISLLQCSSTFFFLPPLPLLPLSLSLSLSPPPPPVFSFPRRSLFLLRFIIRNISDDARAGRLIRLTREVSTFE